MAVNAAADAATVPGRFGTDGLDVGVDLHEPVNHKNYTRLEPFTDQVEKV